MAKHHVLLLPSPAQGHVIPALELAHRLVEQGIKVTFVNTEATQKDITRNWLQNEDLLQMVSVPDGLEPWEDRNEVGKVMESMPKSMPQKLEQLIIANNEQQDNKITCLIVDLWMAWALQVAVKLGIRRATFVPASTITLAIMMSIPKLIEDGFINSNGIPIKRDAIKLTDAMPPIKPENLSWACFQDSSIEAHFQIDVRVAKAATMTEWYICNSAIELEPAVFSLFPELLPIGPLLASNRLADQVGHFWQQDSTCLAWLDQQPTCSVIYIAFGSFTNLNRAQFEELALGLELTNRPFLWVRRPGMTKETAISFPNGYMDRVGSRARIVNWAPQQKVLSHPSIACFISHCGWNSTLEGVTNGLPFLCWPYFCEQFYNEAYICDVWKIGLGFKKDENGIIIRDEIKCKVEQLLSDKTFTSRALYLKEKVTKSVAKGGCSQNNLTKFIEWIHGKDICSKRSY